MLLSKDVTVEQMARSATHANVLTTATKFADGSWVVYISPNETNVSRSLMYVAVHIDKDRATETIPLKTKPWYEQ